MLYTILPASWILKSYCESLNILVLTHNIFFSLIRICITERKEKNNVIKFLLKTTFFAIVFMTLANLAYLEVSMSFQGQKCWNTKMFVLFMPSLLNLMITLTFNWLSLTDLHNFYGFLTSCVFSPKTLCMIGS